jgi:hypothetical protein
MAQRLANVYSRLLSWVTNCTYFPNPIDVDQFKRQRIYEKKKNALTVKTEVTDTEWALDYCRKNNINLEVEVYESPEHIDVREHPNLLGQYTVYVDVKSVNGTVH